MCNQNLQYGRRISIVAEDWRWQVIALYPKLFVRSYRGIPYSPGFPSCADGWRDIVIKLAQRVSSAADDYPVHFRQIVERHGRLDISWTAKAELPSQVEQAIEEAIELAVARSACTCAICGNEGYLVSGGGPLFTACSEHAKGVLAPAPRGPENLHIVRTNFGKDLACRRYNRLSDSFVTIELDALNGNNT
ncbi:hypothetical protein [Bradyrhizobium sp. CCBAU 51753]|uniref:hypothetical protein n=1 Tax=Bradyrhizobium sp. CCBAU 51753 TaxID=1325100 RepID=UPI00188CB2AA|nr:hypothetical protein [Bradyrhizobium sp. CCBAU 51753]